jgi:serine/threonine protein kinase
LKKPIKFGKYVLLERINVGGMAEVFKAKSFGVEGFEKMLAIKRILPNIAEDEEFITMFIDEAKIAVQLNHANIAQIYDLGKIDDSFFIALEYISGKDLRTIWDRHKKRGLLLPIPMSVYIMSRVCEGLDYAHRKKDAGGRDLNIVHRDVSPQNCLISYEGEVKVIDFGIAKAANKASKTQAGILKGKFGYMSPEQVRGLPLDRRSDIFSTGIILYELLTGERLFVGESDFSTLEKVRNVEILPPSTYNRKIPDTLEKIVLKALSKDPDDRYQSAYDLQEELQRFLILNKTNFARKDLANYMKRAFKADIERAAKRQAAYQNAVPEDAVESTASGQTAPGMPPKSASPPKPAAGARPGPARPPAAPAKPPAAPAKPPAAPAKPPAAPAKPPPEVFVGEDDDEDDDIETVVFDPRSAQADGEPATDPSDGRPRGAAPPRPPGPPLGGAKPPPAKGAPPPPPLPEESEEDELDSEMADETAVTAPGDLPRPLPVDPPTDEQDLDLEAFPTGESTAAHQMPQEKKRSRLNLIIAVLAVLAVVVVGLAVYQVLKQKGLLGGEVELTVVVTPADAEVYLDDKRVGDFSPNIIPGVSPGEHVLVAKKANYQDYRETIQLEAGQPRKVAVQMRYIPATLELSVEPPDAEVQLDGERLELSGAGKLRKEDVPPGEHELRFSHPGHETRVVQWTLEPQQTLNKQVELDEIRFAIEVDSEPEGAWVFLDGDRKGRTPLKIEELGAGKHYKLKLKHRRYPEWESTVRYVEGEPVQQIHKRFGDVQGAAEEPAAPERTAVAGRKEPRRKKPRRARPKRALRGTGLLKLNSTPWGRVWIDGEDIGASTPLINHELPAGKHQVTIHFSSGGTKTVTVHIKPNATTKKIVRQ